MTEGMNVKDYDYDLPEELIAQDPLEDRSSSRLMVLDRQTGDVEHRHFTDILEYLHPGDCLVINNTKVIPARLFGVKEDTHLRHRPAASHLLRSAGPEDAGHLL